MAGSTGEVLVEALRASAEAVKTATGRPDQAPRAAQFATAARDLAEALEKLGIKVND